MADLIEDFELLIGRAINYLTRVLHELCRRLNDNSHRPLNRRTLVRWLAAFMPCPKQQKLKLQTNLAASGNLALHRWSSCESLGSGLSSASINQLVEEDLGDNIVRYRRGYKDEDLVEETLEDPSCLPHSKLHDCLTSTPKPSSISSRCSVLSNDPAAKEKLVEMEEELAALRKQIAMLVMAQESSEFSKTVTDPEPESLPSNISHATAVPLPVSPVLSSPDDSGCQSEVKSRKPGLCCITKNPSEHAFVVPAPPEPPPMPSKQPSSNLTFSDQIKQRRKNLFSRDDLTIPARKIHRDREKIPDMVAILKDLGSVKLRAVERSPGGTPIRRHPERDATDPASIIAQALKKKFSGRFIFSSESDKENDSSSFSSDLSTSFGHHIVNKAKKKLNMNNESSDSWTPVASPLKV